jgi:hypothetical protein
VTYVAASNLWILVPCVSPRKLLLREDVGDEGHAFGSSLGFLLFRYMDTTAAMIMRSAIPAGIIPSHAQTLPPCFEPLFAVVDGPGVAGESLLLEVCLNARSRSAAGRRLSACKCSMLSTVVAR